MPWHYQKEADELLQNLINDGIIAWVDGITKWMAPAFMVLKNKRLDRIVKNNLRLVTDRLNRYIVRPVHLFPLANTILSNILSTTKYFASLDAVSGYHQVPLDKELSYLTTFLLTWGHFRYLWAPMGLCSSSDEWCQRSDITIKDMKGVHKLVNDYLVTGDSIKQLTDWIRKILDKCHKQKLTISKWKFVIMKRIKFAGFHLSKEGIEPDNVKTEAISGFPTPKDVTRVWSFLGLVNQLGHFIPNLASLSNPLQQLLKKNTSFLWLKEHEDAFSKIKWILTEKISLQHFDPTKHTYLIADESKLHGLGFILMQSKNRPDKQESIIQCRSCALTPFEHNYTIIELECLAIAWAVNKCNFFLLIRYYHGSQTVSWNILQTVGGHRQPQAGTFEGKAISI